MDLVKSVDKSVATIRQILPGCQSPLGIILGSGFSSWLQRIRILQRINYGDLPGFPQTTVKGHQGELLWGEVAGQEIWIMNGRFHYYEGIPMAVLSLPIRVWQTLGVKQLFITNSAGGINQNFTPGCMMVIEDHINLTGSNPLIGNNPERFGPRFPDASEVYSSRLINLSLQCAHDLGIGIHKGIYLYTTGPSFETPAEIRMMRVLGADAVGMSTVPEAIVGNQAGMEILGLSLITNLASGMSSGPLTHEDVLQTMNRVSHDVIELINLIIKRL